MKKIKEVLKKIFGERHTRRRKVSSCLCAVFVICCLAVCFTVGPGARLIHCLCNPLPDDDQEKLKKVWDMSTDNAIGSLVRNVFRWDLNTEYDFTRVFDDRTIDYIVTPPEGISSIKLGEITYTFACGITPEDDDNFELEIGEKLADFTGSGEDIREALEGEEVTMTLYRLKNTAETCAAVAFVSGEDMPYLYDNTSYGEGMELTDYLETVGIRDVTVLMMTGQGMYMYYPDFPLEYLMEKIAPCATQISEEDACLEGAYRTGLAIMWRTYGGERMKLNFLDNGCLSIQYTGAIVAEECLYYDLNDPELSFGTELITWLRKNHYELMYGFGWPFA